MGFKETRSAVKTDQGQQGILSLSDRIFSPNLKPLRVVPVPSPPSLAWSKLPPPAAEIDERPTWRLRRFKLWRDAVPPLRMVVLDPKRRNHLRRFQSFAIPATPCRTRGSFATPCLWVPPTSLPFQPHLTTGPIVPRPLQLPHPPVAEERGKFKLSRIERRTRRLRLWQFKYALDQEHERRFRQGMTLLFHQVAAFENRHITTKPDGKTQWGSVVPLGCVTSITQFFRDIRKKSETVYRYLDATSIRPVARRDELHRAVKQQDRERQKRKEKKEAKKAQEAAMQNERARKADLAASTASVDLHDEYRYPAFEDLADTVPARGEDQIPVYESLDSRASDLNRPPRLSVAAHEVSPTIQAMTDLSLEDVDGPARADERTRNASAAEMEADALTDASTLSAASIPTPQASAHSLNSWPTNQNQEFAKNEMKDDEMTLLTMKEHLSNLLMALRANPTEAAGSDTETSPLLTKLSKGNSGDPSAARQKVIELTKVNETSKKVRKQGQANRHEASKDVKNAVHLSSRAHRLQRANQPSLHHPGKEQDRKRTRTSLFQLRDQNQRSAPSSEDVANRLSRFMMIKETNVDLSTIMPSARNQVGLAVPKLNRLEMSEDRQIRLADLEERVEIARTLPPEALPKSPIAFSVPERISITPAPTEPDSSLVGSDFPVSEIAFGDLNKDVDTAAPVHSIARTPSNSVATHGSSWRGRLEPFWDSDGAETTAYSESMSDTTAVESFEGQIFKVRDVTEAYGDTAAAATAGQERSEADTQLIADLRSLSVSI